MKKILFVLLLSIIALSANAQAVAPIPTGYRTPTFARPYWQPTTWQATGYMLNDANSYSYLNVSPFVPSYRDTVTTSSATYTLYLTASTGGSSYVPLPLTSIGALNITIAGTLISGTVTGTAVLQTSPDNVTWYPYKASNTIGNDTLTFSATALYYSWYLPLHPSLYYRVKLVFTSSTQSTSWVSQWYLKDNFYDNAEH